MTSSGKRQSAEFDKRLAWRRRHSAPCEKREEREQGLRAARVPDHPNRDMPVLRLVVKPKIAKAVGCTTGPFAGPQVRAGGKRKNSEE
jgi:hypothetical protein